ncbi:MAG TPA: response regulator [Gemmatimonadaceae bacterium]|nr:response regulator [Gemmatimonadaceae bacterium]
MMSPTSQQVSAMIAPKSEQPARILIIDDQEQNTRPLTRILQRAGYEKIASTTNPSDALAIQSQFNPDLVLLDVHMRGKDGFEVLTELLSSDRDGEHLPVIMLTADDRAGCKASCARTGREGTLSASHSILPRWCCASGICWRRDSSIRH